MTQQGHAAPLPVELVEQLQDIREPTGVDAWPLAPGWWWLLVVVTLFAAGLGRYYLSRYGLRRAALRELHCLQMRYSGRDEGPAFAMAVSVLLRRVALARFPRRQVAGLTGSAWLEFLDRTGGSRDFTEGPGALLAQRPYQSGFEVDRGALRRTTELWLRRNT